MSFQFPSMESGHRHRKSKCRTGSAPFLRRQPEAWGLHLHCLLAPQPPLACEGRGPAQEEKMQLSLGLIHLAQAQDPGQICSTSSPISSMKMGGGGAWNPRHLNRVITSWLEHHDTGILAFQMNRTIQWVAFPLQWCSEVLSKQALCVKCCVFKMHQGISSNH